jgi:hypothetical protein
MLLKKSEESLTTLIDMQIRKGSCVLCRIVDVISFHKREEFESSETIMKWLKFNRNEKMDLKWLLDGVMSIVMFFILLSKSSRVVGKNSVEFRKFKVEWANSVRRNIGINLWSSIQGNRGNLMWYSNMLNIDRHISRSNSIFRWKEVISSNKFRNISWEPNSELTICPTQIYSQSSSTLNSSRDLGELNNIFKTF